MVNGNKIKKIKTAKHLIFSSLKNYDMWLYMVGIWSAKLLLNEFS